MSLAHSITRKSRWYPWLLLGLLLPCGLQAEPQSTATAAPATRLTIQVQPSIDWLTLDARIEPIDQGSVAAQTAGRVNQITVDVNDVVPPGSCSSRSPTPRRVPGWIRPRPPCRPPNLNSATRIASWHA